MKYKVHGTVEMNFECEVDADSEEEANELATGMVEEGDVIDVVFIDNVDDPEITLTELIG